LCCNPNPSFSHITHYFSETHFVATFERANKRFSTVFIIIGSSNSYLSTAILARAHSDILHSLHEAHFPAELEITDFDAQIEL
jgi:hypothetical protein